MRTLLDQLQQLAPLAALATEGPWAFAPAGDYDAWVLIREADIKRHHEEQEAFDFASVGHIADAAFIAAARNLLTPENLALLVAALARPAAADADLLPLVTAAVKAWAMEDWDDDNDTPLPDRTNEQESADLLRCLRHAGLSISIVATPAP